MRHPFISAINLDEFYIDVPIYCICTINHDAERIFTIGGRYLIMQ